jgi:5-methylthioadenosine/S-adenosylhomocysteine deaminase
MSTALRITGAKIADPEGATGLTDGTDIWIADGRIAALAPADAPAPAPVSGPYQTLTFSHAVAMPGLVNAHTHSASALLRGTNAGLPVDLYCLQAAVRRTPKLMDEVRICVLLQAMEMQKRGVTSVVDHFRHGGLPTIEAIAAVFSAYEESGMRAAVAPMFDDKRYIDSLPLSRTRLPAQTRARWGAMRPPAADDYFRIMAEVVAHWRGHDRLGVVLGIEGPPRGTQRLFELAGDFAARHGIGIHTHLLEAKTQAMTAPPDCNGSLVEYLDRFGLIGPKSSLAHFIWCNERDVARSAERGVNIVHNPVSNLLFGSGLQPTARLLGAGINVALGSDGAGGNQINLLEQAKFAMLLSRISQVDCSRWITARQALRMATRNGGAVIGEPGMLGVIRVGARADLVVIDMSSQAFRPLGDIWTHLVMYETGAAVDTVIIDGKVVVRHGRLTWIDEADLLAEADRLAARGRAESAQSTGAEATERAVFEPLVLELLRRPLAIDRFAHLD